MDPDQWFYWKIGGTVVALMVGAGVYYFWIREPEAIIYKSGQIPMTKVSRRYRRTSKGIVTFVEPHLQIPLCLAEKTSLSHNVRKFRFALPSAHHVAGLEACQHVRVSAEIDGKTVVRPYTPVSDDDLVGFVDIVVKIYKKSEKFPNGGALSQYLDSLCVGDKINFRGPTFQHIYHGNGQFSTGHTPANTPDKTRYAHFKRISLIAGGTGITPILQIMNKSLKDPDDKTEFALLFGNQTQDDILLKNELDEIHEKHPSRFRVTHILSQPIPDQPWGGLTGYITADPIRRTLFPVDPNTAFVICGPPAMREKAVLPALQELGVDKDHIFVM